MSGPRASPSFPTSPRGRARYCCDPHGGRASRGASSRVHIRGNGPGHALARLRDRGGPEACARRFRLGAQRGGDQARGLSLRPANRSDRGGPCERAPKFRHGGDAVALQGALRGLSAGILMPDLKRERRLRERYNLYLPVIFRIDVTDFDQAAGKLHPDRRHHRGLRRRLEHQTTARARAAHRGQDRDAHGPEDPDVKPAQARLLLLPAIPCQPARAASMGSQTRLPTGGPQGSMLPTSDGVPKIRLFEIT